MAKANSIQAFPSHIDRVSFGHWLSGFVDGEGCFKLNGRRYSDTMKPFCQFAIALRSDDISVLQNIQSFWQCGRLHFSGNTRCKIPNAKPTACLSVIKMSDLAEIVVPHFESFPLRAKKAGDFLIWKEAIALCFAVTKQKQTYTFRLNSSGTRNSFAGISPKWQPEQTARYFELKEQLKAHRSFQPTIATSHLSV